MSDMKSFSKLESLTMRASALRAAVLGLAAMGSMPIVAHHSAAMYDPEKLSLVTGTIKDFQYTNPHSEVLVIAEDADGKTVEWNLESEGPSTLMRAGIKRSSFQPGEKVTFCFHPMKDGRPAGIWIRATKPDGTVLSTLMGAGPAGENCAAATPGTAKTAPTAP
jgi:Family of unknown function (DUF6152)